MWWRPEPLSEGEKSLLDALLEAHHASVFRDNISSQVVMAAMTGSGDYLKAIAAGLMTLGNLHGPIQGSMLLLKDAHPEALAKKLIDSGALVPGWGSSFSKDGPDPIWYGVAELIPITLSQKIASVTDVLHEAGKKVWANPSAYTAACAIELRVPVEISPYLLLSGRIAGWTELAMRAYNSRRML